MRLLESINFPEEEVGAVSAVCVLPYCAVGCWLPVPTTMGSDWTWANSLSAASALSCFTLSNVSVSCILSRQGNAIIAGTAPAHWTKWDKTRLKINNDNSRHHTLTLSPSILNSLSLYLQLSTIFCVWMNVVCCTFLYFLHFQYFSRLTECQWKSPWECRTKSCTETYYDN